MTEKIRRFQVRALLGIPIVAACGYLAWLWPDYQSHFVLHLGPDWGTRFYENGRGGFLLIFFAQGFISITWLVRATLLERQRSASRSRAKT